MTALNIPLDVSEAKRITTRIKLRLETIAENAEAVVDLITQAKAGNAHIVLGFESWPAYVVANFGGTLARLDRAERGSMVAMLSDAGLSTRAIAPVVGVSNKTVHQDLVRQHDGDGLDLDRDLDHQVLPEVTPAGPVTGLDGKTYPRPATFLPSGKPDATSTEAMGNAVPKVTRKARRRPLPDQYRAALWDLDKAIVRLERMQGDDRFSGVVRDAGTLAQMTGLLDRLNKVIEPHIVAIEKANDGDDR